jgi:hypothetical protein
MHTEMSICIPKLKKTIAAFFYGECYSILTNKNSDADTITDFCGYKKTCAENKVKTIAY